MDISGRRALVTGGAHRVGKGIALALAGAGADLVLHYNRSAGPAEATADEARALGSTVELRQADLSDPDSIAALLSDPVDILVNSAAGFPSDHLLDVSLEQWERTIGLNLTAPVFLTQAFARSLPEDRTGAVVNVTDWKTERPYLGPRFSYTIAKGAIDTFTRVAASELAPRIRVNAVALGVVLPPADAEEGYAERLASQTPLEKIGGVETVAQAVLHFIRNDFITGEIQRLDGGAHLR
ncbi:MAG: SDR family oxidoreductase, partial [Acidimicrobiia bacterium]|nr:SDR family oxidoreductase [Acidimicrobiia bacterium]MBT8192038.1 SDR family oxidoreductase [Acidimicrobiia bacterium]MBT8248129.1 SDR family oxidoreductase [Acidimicrobiia bacterium]NNF88051.1 SDR family oxidoreductase [Acidimicrobiia bacterium]NNJ47355.1 SDR family oxidoreductase [Acidimicrobiia bacterium]